MKKERVNPYAHPMRGLLVAIGGVLVFLLFLAGLTAIVWWLA